MAKKAKRKAKVRGEAKVKAKVKVKVRKRAGAPAPKKAAKDARAPKTGEILDRIHAVVRARKGADPETSHSAKLLSRGTAKVAQKFAEEAAEAMIEAVRKDRTRLIAESADVLYHLLVVWVDAAIRPADVWRELARREGRSGIAEKAARAKALALKQARRRRRLAAAATRKIW
ncbi:MAG: phosphoribosyl-ATP diphosphatase [Alphaproteobacteria bacterium]|nr:phosphoribosyl-ATP diphosphatase [Alphaproteobacteria bacterium]